jgi:hypothetical protein
MKFPRMFVSVAILTAVVLTGFAPTFASASTSWIHNGRYDYSPHVAGTPAAFTVVGNGTKMEWLSAGYGGITCTVSPSLIALDPSLLFPTSYVNIIVPNLTISPSGAFSYSGNVTLYYLESPLTLSTPLRLKLNGHFVKAPIEANTTIAAVGTFSAPEICKDSTITKMSFVWTGATPRPN